MTSTTEARVDAKDQIHKLMDSWAEAVRSKDIDAAMAPYYDGVVAFDLIEPLQYQGAATVRKRLEEWFSQFEGNIGCELQAMHIVAGGDTAFCYGLNRVSGTTVKGDEIDMWWRSTLCWQNIDGDWTITHEHSSVPFDMKTGQASMELTPEYLAEQGGS